MTVDPIEWSVILFSLAPLLVLAVSKLWTDYYRMKIAKGKVELSNQRLPLLVRFYGWSVSSLSRSLVVYVGSVAFMFLFPFLLYLLYWPGLLSEYASGMLYLALPALGLALLFVFAASPDETGGLGVPAESLTTTRSPSDNGTDEHQS